MAMGRVRTHPRFERRHSGAHPAQLVGGTVVMDENGAARFSEGFDLRDGDDTVLEFGSGGRGGDDVFGFRHKLIIIAARTSTEMWGCEPQHRRTRRQTGRSRPGSVQYYAHYLSPLYGTAVLDRRGAEASASDCGTEPHHCCGRGKS